MVNEMSDTRDERNAFICLNLDCGCLFRSEYDGAICPSCGDQARAKITPAAYEKIRTDFVAEYREGLGEVEGCTPGPWEWYEDFLESKAGRPGQYGFVMQVCISSEFEAEIQFGMPGDRALIARAPEMAAEIRQLREEMKEARLIAEPEKAPRFNVFAHQRQQDEIKKLCEERGQLSTLIAMFRATDGDPEGEIAALKSSAGNGE